VDAFFLEHGQTPHLGYRIDCGGRTLAHLGDAAPSEANFTRVLQAAPSPDVALVPHWWLTDEDGLRFVTRRWKPGHVVAIHLGGGDAQSVSAIRSRAPEVWLCTRAGESRTY
jgi:L-ascorbate metabolism protein UlaG (beta-lactamase superfamily)